jgi:hypothetical protein
MLGNARAPPALSVNHLRTMQALNRVLKPRPLPSPVAPHALLTLLRSGLGRFTGSGYGAAAKAVTMASADEMTSSLRMALQDADAPTGLDDSEMGHKERQMVPHVTVPLRPPIADMQADMRWLRLRVRKRHMHRSKQHHYSITSSGAGQQRRRKGGQELWPERRLTSNSPLPD